MAAVAADTQLREGIRVPSKRKLRQRERSNPKDAKAKRLGGAKSRGTAKKLRQRRKAAEDDDSSAEDEEKESEAAGSGGDGDSDESDDEGEVGQEEGDGGSGTEEDEERGEETRKGVTKFTHGCRAFKVAFAKIMKKSARADELLGPVLSAHKKLIVKKLAEEEEEQTTKGEAKKERHLAAEKGHVIPDSFLDSKEKFLISVATKGVVKLFNAVNKAQNPQKGLNPSSSKDAKELAKRRKEAFFSEIRKPTTADPKLANSNHEPGWAPLRDSYMLTSSKIKDWDKMENPSTSAGQDMVHSEGSSEEE